jgi:CRP-like cAMP-binding protein
MEDIEFLKYVFVLQGLGEDQIKTFLTIARKVCFKKGDTILREGEEGDAMYIIRDGKVEVSKTLTMKMEGMAYQKQEKAISQMSEDDHMAFGEFALLEEKVRSASITCLTDCTFYEIERKDFLELAERDFEIGYRIVNNIARMLCTRLRRANEDTIRLTTALSIALSR